MDLDLDLDLGWHLPWTQGGRGPVREARRYLSLEVVHSSAGLATSPYYLESRRTSITACKRPWTHSV